MRKVHTFDIFDSLVARRCVSASNIFKEVERDSKHENFTKIRTQAEKKISDGPHTLDSIYDEIVRSFGIEKITADTLKKMEINYELRNVIPIQENIDKVHDGDVLITDTYLPRWVIESILEKVNLRKQVGLVLSNSGKNTGDVWPKLRDSILIEQHLGNNVHSDINIPLSNGIFSVPAKNHQLTNIETHFESIGFIYLARVIREARLRSCTGNLTRLENEQRMLQINYNMPMLLMACVHIHKTVQEHGVDQILFSSRDCYVLERMYRHLAKTLKWHEKSSYFFTSRVSRLTSSKPYISYFNSLNKGKSMVVDMCGTGWSLGQLYSQANCQPYTYLVHYLNNSSINKTYEEISPFKTSEKPLFLTDDPTLSNAVIEFANYTFSGMFLDMKSLEGYGAFIPEFEDPNYPPAVINALKQIQFGQDVFMEAFKNHDLLSLMTEFDLNASKIPSMFVEQYKLMAQNRQCMSDISDYHNSQDKKSMLRLRNA